MDHVGGAASILRANPWRDEFCKSIPKRGASAFSFCRLFFARPFSFARLSSCRPFSRLFCRLFSSGLFWFSCRGLRPISCRRRWPCSPLPRRGAPPLLRSRRALHTLPRCARLAVFACRFTSSSSLEPFLVLLAWSDKTPRRSKGKLRAGRRFRWAPATSPTSGPTVHSGPYSGVLLHPADRFRSQHDLEFCRALDLTAL